MLKMFVYVWIWGGQQSMRGVRTMVVVMQGKSGVGAVAGAFRELRACEALRVRLCVVSGSGQH